MSVLHELCIDVQLIVYKYIHRQALHKCFKKIDKHLVWDSEDNMYKSKDGDGFRANWRYKGRGGDDIFSIWYSRVSLMRVIPAKLPNRYHYTSGIPKKKIRM